MIDQPESRPAQNIRPRVGVPRNSTGVWVFGIALALLAISLFVLLESRRATLSTPTITASYAEGDQIMSPPPIVVTPEYSDPYPPVPAFMNAPSQARVARQPPLAIQRVRPAREQFDPDMMPTRDAQMTPQPQPMPSSAPDTGAAALGLVASAPAGERVLARHFSNPGTTVPQGTVIQAVLESALDSTRPGFARAIISRDVYGFDGARVLIPRGSRLIGDYKADLQPGQKRALIQWQRLMRPDGVLVNLDSPSADPLGRAGVEGKVDSHFVERFGGSILQSALNVGTQIAINRASDGNVIYAVPLQGQMAPQIGSEKVQPTVKVKQGTSVSVFVARDLDFTDVSP
ncbi:TrbI/VirB10 family protein [Sphingobium olei]|uniref:TrbI/VirB10 family protein n=1 Tax=Sphingobium olei TaxID=420955 RepID=A0ABW3P0N0_9SPHN